MRGDLSGARDKLRRAKHHIDELDKEWDQWFEPEPKPWGSKLIREPNGDHVYQFQVVREMPIHWSCVLGDALHNMRSALDLMVWQLALLSVASPHRHNTMFIARATEADYRSAVKGKLKELSQDALDFLEGLRPWGADSALYALAELNNTDKHRVLLLVATAVVGGGIRVKLLPNGLLPNGEQFDPVQFFNRGKLEKGGDWAVRIPARLTQYITGVTGTYRPIIKDDPGSDARAGAFSRLCEMHYTAARAVNSAQLKFFGGLNPMNTAETYKPRINTGAPGALI